MNFYARLDVPENASYDEIRKAYYKKISEVFLFKHLIIIKILATS